MTDDIAVVLRITDMFGPGCDVCDHEGHVCENHPEQPWDGTSARDDACGCGAGMPCLACSPRHEACEACGTRLLSRPDEAPVEDDGHGAPVRVGRTPAYLEHTPQRCRERRNALGMRGVP